MIARLYDRIFGGQTAGQQLENSLIPVKENARRRKKKKE